MDASAPNRLEQAIAVLAAWRGLAHADVEPLGRGLINDTFAVRSHSGEALVLQRLHPVFAPDIHHNIARVTERLHAAGMATPRLRPTVDGALWHVADGAPWRVMTRIAGVTHDAVASPAQANAAAALLGAFHRTLHGLDPESFVAMRSGVHDTVAHLDRLRRALDGQRGHRLYDAVAQIATPLLSAAETLSPLPEAPARIVHGDPKLNNVVFAASTGAGANEAIAWIDLDTVGPMPLAYELGDAWRSWCNPAGEDATQAVFDLEIYAASLRGWACAVAPAPSAAEREGLLVGVEWITLELAARFLADALLETYFGWDATRFAGRGEHNLVRARSQWSLHERVVQQRSARAAALQAELG